MKKNPDYFKNLLTALGLIPKSVFAFFMALFGRTAEGSVPHQDLADNVYYRPTQEEVDVAVKALTIAKEEHGITRANYRPERPDCDDASLFDRYQLNFNILPQVCGSKAAGKAFRIGEYSFRRDDGKRHRVAFIENDKGRRTYIDSYNGIDGNDGIVRTLSKKERSNGHEVG